MQKHFSSNFPVLHYNLGRDINNNMKSAADVLSAVSSKPMLSPICRSLFHLIQIDFNHSNQWRQAWTPRPNSFHHKVGMKSKKSGKPCLRSSGFSLLISGELNITNSGIEVPKGWLNLHFAISETSTAVNILSFRRPQYFSTIFVYMKEIILPSFSSFVCSLCPRKE